MDYIRTVLDVSSLVTKLLQGKARPRTIPLTSVHRTTQRDAEGKHTATYDFTKDINGLAIPAGSTISCQYGTFVTDADHRTTYNNYIACKLAYSQQQSAALATMAYIAKQEAITERIIKENEALATEVGALDANQNLLPQVQHLTTAAKLTRKRKRDLLDVEEFVNYVDKKTAPGQ
jgi:hypothetical protein